MRISLLSLFLTACASLPDVQPCDPTGAVIDPDFVAIGNDDQMIASMRWVGCEDVDFQLCGIGTGWVGQETITLGIWHDDLTIHDCGDEEQISDELFNLSSVRRRYEKDYKVKSASVVLNVGTHLVPYSFFKD